MAFIKKVAGKGNAKNTELDMAIVEELKNLFLGDADFSIGQIGIKCNDVSDAISQANSGMLPSGSLNKILSYLSIPMGGSYQERVEKVSAYLETL